MWDKTRSLWLRFARVVILKWYSIGLAVVSFFYGLILFDNPEILISYEMYETLNEIFDQRIISSSFMILGAMKLLGVFINNRVIKRVSLSLLVGLWLVFSTSFFFNGPPNTVGILTLGYAWIALGIAVREVLE